MNNRMSHREVVDLGTEQSPYKQPKALHEFLCGFIRAFRETETQLPELVPSDESKRYQAGYRSGRRAGERMRRIR